MTYFHLLEIVASEVFNSNAMAQHSRTAYYLSAVATISQALARRQRAVAEILLYSELLDRMSDENMKSILETQMRQSERDQELVELELRGIDLWTNTRSGALIGKDQVAEALNELAADVRGGRFSKTFLNDEEMDLLVGGSNTGFRP